MVTAPRLVQLVAKLDGHDVRNERTRYENGACPIGDVSNEIDRQLISTSMNLGAVRPDPDKDIRVECEIVGRVVMPAHRPQPASGTITRSR